MVALIGAWSLAGGAVPDPELDAVAALETSGLPIPRN
jgi:hypothetical protein